jgi:hypothetical protein
MQIILYLHENYSELPGYVRAYAGLTDGLYAETKQPPDLERRKQRLQM